jgi:rhodanese-related sulfurtransferase
MQNSANNAAPTISPEEALRRQEAGAVIVDVREPDEWQAGHVPGAKHIPLGSLGARMGELDPNAEIIAVCHSGVRSDAAVKALRRAGFGNAWNLAGGMVAWERKKLPIVR